jgi:hypothetical protein
MMTKKGGTTIEIAIWGVFLPKKPNSFATGRLCTRAVYPLRWSQISFLRIKKTLTGDPTQNQFCTRALLSFPAINPTIPFVRA